MKSNDAVFGAMLVILGCAVLFAIRSYPHIPGQNVGPALFPGLIASALVVCGLLLAVSGFRARARSPWFEPLPWIASRRHVAAFAILAGSVIAYILFADRLGFMIVAPLALFAMFLSLRVTPVRAAVIAVVASGLIWYAFYKLLRVPLPWGVLQRFAF